MFQSLLGHTVGEFYLDNIEEAAHISPYNLSPQSPDISSANTSGLLPNLKY